MKKAALIITSSLALIIISCTERVNEYHLYYLGGQSNMDGYGFTNDLTAEMNDTVPGVIIFHGNTAEDNTSPDGKGKWDILQPGHGVGFWSDGSSNFLSNRFGVELSFAKKMKELAREENIAIIKYSRGGTSIDTLAAFSYGCWLPDYRKGNGVNQYDHLLATVKNALAYTDIDGDGKPDRLIPSGIIWMQGESDALVEYSANVYKENLSVLMKEIRVTLGSMDMPVVIGRISDSHNDTDSIVWTFGDIVRKAQADFTQEDGNASLVTSTDNYSFSDPWHYDSKGYLDLGEKFAEAMADLKKR